MNSKEGEKISTIDGLYIETCVYVSLMYYNVPLTQRKFSVNE